MKLPLIILCSLLLLIVILAILRAGNMPRQTPAITDMQEPFISFSVFLASVEEANFEDYQALEGTVVRDEVAFEAMKLHILNLYENVETVHSYVEDGQYFDCIHILSQPGLDDPGLQSQPEPVSRPALDEMNTAIQSLHQETLVNTTIDSRDVFGRLTVCETDTIPMRRLRLEDLIQYEDLSSFLTK